MDDVDIFWGEVTNEEGNVVRAAPKNGDGPVRTLGKWYDFASTSSLVVDQTHVYWLRNDSGGVLVRVNKDGSASVTTDLPVSPAGAGGTAGARLDFGPLRDAGDAIILATQGCTSVARIPKNGSAASVFEVSPYPNGGVTTGLDVAGGFAYCSNGEHIHALDLQTGASREIVRNQRYAGPMLWVGGDLYFVNDRGSSNTGENLAVLRAGAGADAAIDLGGAAGFVDRLHFDDKRRTITWVTGFHWLVSEVVVYRLDGGAPPEILLDKQDVMGGSAADADAVYWLSDHQVTRLKKSP